MTAFSAQPLIDFLRVHYPDAGDAANSVNLDHHELCGLTRKTWQALKSSGCISSLRADEVACHLRVNPVDIWPEWYEGAADEDRCVVCGWPTPLRASTVPRVYCSDACKRARQWWQGKTNGSLVGYDRLRLQRHLERCAEVTERVARMTPAQLAAFLGIDDATELAVAA